jgi:hypothetical protein
VEVRPAAEQLVKLGLDRGVCGRHDHPDARERQVDLDGLGLSDGLSAARGVVAAWWGRWLAHRGDGAASSSEALAPAQPAPKAR